MSRFNYYTNIILLIGILNPKILYMWKIRDGYCVILVIQFNMKKLMEYIVYEAHMPFYNLIYNINLKYKAL